MNCSFCHGHGRAAGFMSAEQFSHVLRELDGVTKHLYFHLMGEPLCHPQLPELLTTARERGFRPMLTTNGTLLPSRGDEIIKAVPHKVNVSLHSFEDGDCASHGEYLRGVADFAARAAEAGILVVLRLWNNGFDNGTNDRAIARLRRLLPGEWADHCRGLKLRRGVYLEWGEHFEWPDDTAEVNSGAVFCHGMRDHFGILCDGTVVPCCLDSEGRLALGNVFRESLRAIISSDRAREIKAALQARRAPTELCRRCGYARSAQKIVKGIKL